MANENGKFLIKIDNFGECLFAIINFITNILLQFVLKKKTKSCTFILVRIFFTTNTIEFNEVFLKKKSKKFQF